jgi:hypothetical protein
MITSLRLVIPPKMKNSPITKYRSCGASIVWVSPSVRTFCVPLPMPCATFLSLGYLNLRVPFPVA